MNDSIKIDVDNKARVGIKIHRHKQRLILIMNIFYLPTTQTKYGTSLITAFKNTGPVLFSYTNNEFFSNKINSKL